MKELSDTTEWPAPEYQEARRVSFESTFKDSASRDAARISFRRRIISTVAAMISAASANPIESISQFIVTCHARLLMDEGCACYQWG